MQGRQQLAQAQGWQRLPGCKGLQQFQFHPAQQHIRAPLHITAPLYE